jgi:GTP-binding protein
MIEGYIKESPQIRVVVVLLDIRREPDERDRRLIEWLAHYGVPAFYVLTKADKVKRNEAAQARLSIAKKLGLPEKPLLISGKTGQGIVELQAEIAKRLKHQSEDSTASVIPK